jgi:transposase
MRRYIAPEVKEMVVKLALVRKYRYKKIKRITGVSVRSIKRLKALYLCTGEVVRKRVVDGRPRTLNGFEASVSESLSQYRKFNKTCILFCMYLVLGRLYRTEVRPDAI